MVARVADEAVLRAKYLDWCSARLADHFLQLTPGEIYELAQEAADAGEGGIPGWQVAGALAVAGDGSPRADGSGVTGREAAVRPAAESYRTLVERVTGELAARLSIPSFEQWLASYRDAPSHYDEELLGFWKELDSGA